MPEAATELWYVSEGGKVHGPYTRNMLQGHVNSRRFATSALVWKKYFSSWQPVALHFKASDQPEPVEVVAPTTPTVSASSPFGTSSIHHIRWLLTLSAILLFALVAMGFAVNNDLGRSGFWLVRIGLIGAMSLSTAAAAFVWWRYPLPSAASDRAVGAVRALVISFSLAVGISAFVCVANTPLLYRLHIAREAYRHYNVSVDIASHTLSIEGLIGPGLSQEVAQQLRSNAAIKTVAINSIGGLVNEAMKVAREIESHGRLSTRTWHTCNSACILVFMAGEQRTAERDLRFGFHATSSITPIQGVYDVEALGSEDAATRKYLAARGIPVAFIDGARARGPDKLYPVSAIQMADVGAVTQLLNGGEVISIARAKWLDIIDVQRRGHGYAPFIKLLTTVAEVDPQSVEKFGPPLWLAAQSEDVTALGVSLRGMVGALAAKAVAAADDEPLANMLKINATEIKYLRDTGKWDVCAGFANGKGFGIIKPPAQLLESDLNAQTLLISSAAENRWHPRDVPAWTSGYGTSMAQRLAAKMVQAGMDVKDVDTNPHVSCEWSAALFAEMSEKPPSISANLYRWLMAGTK